MGNFSEVDSYGASVRMTLPCEKIPSPEAGVLDWEKYLSFADADVSDSELKLER